MAAFFYGGSEIQDASDHGMQPQNLCFMNLSTSLPYSDNSPTNSTTIARFFNPSALPSHTLTHAPPPSNYHTHLVGVPLPTNTTTMGPAATTAASLDTNHQYCNLWSGSPVDQNPTHSISLVVDGAHGFELLRRDQRPPPLAVVSPGNSKRLSLSLSSQQQQHHQGLYRSSNNTHHREQGNSPVSTVSNGVVLGLMQGGGGSVLASKYLKAAQKLLGEIVSVGNNGTAKDNIEDSKEKLKMKKESTVDKLGGAGENKPAVGELTSMQRQELQMKKAKLVSMMEEVEQRYRQYHHQMETIISSFEQAAGFNSAKSYTSLALQTISKQFRCLKGTISLQIKSISKTLGEDDCIGAKGESSRLRFVDNQFRHLGMIQHHHNAWRPQRGLPERAVSILRAWLFEHFLHPYPRDSDKHMLAKQTGLTRSQVSNWFINARVRLWKPMVEEMYLEEMKEQEGKSCDQTTNNRKSNEQHKEFEGSSSKSTKALQESNTSLRMDSKLEKFNIYNNNASPTDQCSSSIPSTNCLTGGGRSINHQEFGFDRVEMHQGVNNSPPISHPKKLRSNENFGMQNSRSSIISFDMEMKQQGDHTGRETNLANCVGEFGNYHPMEDIGRFYGNGVSLSLGLPHCENKNNTNLSLSENQPNFLSNQSIDSIQFGTSQIEFSGVSTTGLYQNINAQNKKRFAAAPLLPDFFS